MAEPLIELHGVGRTYGPFVALRDVNLRLEPGRIGLLGPNGAGKSTLLKLLMGLLAPTTGHGRVLGHGLRSGGWSERDAWALRRQIGFMPEADALVPGLLGVEYVALAGELAGMPRRQAQRRAHELLTCLELEDARYRKLEEYSLGMKQRIKMAQALVHDPPLLLLDEPTSGLDPAGRDAMLSLLKSLGRDHGKSLILSTHLLADVETVCEQVVIVTAGQIRGQGRVDELCARRRDRWRVQVQGAIHRFREQLDGEGIRVLADNGRGELRVTVPSGWSTRGFFALADNTGSVVKAMQPDDESLEELFLRVVQ